MTYSSRRCGLSIGGRQVAAKGSLTGRRKAPKAELIHYQSTSATTALEASAGAHAPASPGIAPLATGHAEEPLIAIDYVTKLWRCHRVTVLRLIKRGLLHPTEGND